MSRRNAAQDITADLNRLLAVGGEVRVRWLFGRYEVSVFDQVGPGHAHYEGATLDEAMAKAANEHVTT